MGLFGRRSIDETLEERRLEERLRGLAQATEEWRSLLREMEGSGESSNPQYERYYHAYVEARQQEKRADLALFNLRRGLVNKA